MPTVIQTRFREALQNSSSWAFGVSYEDKKRMEEGDYAAVAQERLDTIERQVFYRKLSAGAAVLLMGMGAVVVLLARLDVIAGVEGEAWEQFLFLALCFGAGAAGQSWQVSRLEKLRVLAELVLEEDQDRSSASQDQRAEPQTAQDEAEPVAA
jgi:hypothetical protein